MADPDRNAGRRRPAGRYDPTPGVDWGQRLRQPGWVLLPLRLFLGATFLFAGLQKLADPLFFRAASATSIQSQLALFRQTSPLRSLLGPVAGHAVLFGVGVALAEIAVGLGTLLGLWARVAAAGGALLALSFFLTVSWTTRPYYYGSDIGFFVAWLSLALAGTGGVLSLDGVLRRRAAHDLGLRPNPDRPLPPADRRALDRRTVVRGGAIASVVGTAAVVLAGASAGLGHLVSRRSGRSGSPGRTGAAPTTSASTPAGPAPGAAAAAPTGARIARTSEVPVGGAVPFTDPATHQPAFVVQPAAGRFAAFSAICTHAGCTVNFDSSDQRFHCPCHGAVYDGSTGRVLAGPTSRGLREVPVTAAGGELRLRS